MSLEVPGTFDFTEKRRVPGGHKSYATMILGQSAVLVFQLSHEDVLQLRQQKLHLEEKLATIKILDNQTCLKLRKTSTMRLMNQASCIKEYAQHYYNLMIN